MSDYEATSTSKPLSPSTRNLELQKKVGCDPFVVYYLGSRQSQPFKTRCLRTAEGSTGGDTATAVGATGAAIIGALASERVRGWSSAVNPRQHPYKCSSVKVSDSKCSCSRIQHLSPAPPEARIPSAFCPWNPAGTE